MQSLMALQSQYGEVTSEEEQFLTALESSIAEDLWKSAGGIWSEASIEVVREKALLQWNEHRRESPESSLQESWVFVVRDFHRNYWGEQKLEKKPKKEKTAEQKIFWELFSYIWALIQAALVMKTVVFYFGIKSAREDTTEGKIYVALAILVSFSSLGWFAFRKTKKKSQQD